MKKTSIKRERQGRFAPGASPNPGGRPRVVALVRELAQQHGEEALQKIIDLLQSDDERIVLAAAKEILDRAYGKPDQAHKIEGDGIGKTVVVIRDMSQYPDEDDGGDDEAA
ncbi:hypothetical protein LJB86_05485 [Deltaproteobacteria bacterium OttesenSCG-928-M10]|nr:hypothetical protein [Deltaproteobacteria bacterium OttesenSCG-928-M10]